MTISKGCMHDATMLCNQFVIQPILHALAQLTHVLTRPFVGHLGCIMLDAPIKSALHNIPCTSSSSSISSAAASSSSSTTMRLHVCHTCMVRMHGYHLATQSTCIAYLSNHRKATRKRFCMMHRHHHEVTYHMALGAVVLPHLK